MATQTHLTQLVLTHQELPDLPSQVAREWLVTNGIGGFASGTIADQVTRRYHGYLIAAQKPPLGRTLRISKLEATIHLGDTDYPLYANQISHRQNGSAPNPASYLQEFRLDGTIPTWTYQCGTVHLCKRVWMAEGKNVTFVQYQVLHSAIPLTLSVDILANYRDYHANTHHPDWQPQVTPRKGGLILQIDPTLPPTYVYITHSGTLQLDTPLAWRHDVFLAVEDYRGLDALDDQLHMARLNILLNPGQQVVIVLSDRADFTLTQDDWYETRRTEEIAFLDKIDAAHHTPEWIQRLMLAARQFIVTRQTTHHPDGCTILAGYPWFGDWGRDTMISLPGLTLATGLYEDAERILRIFAEYVDHGMLPNRFPDDNETPEYNTVDATLWFFEALMQYYRATGDSDLIADLYHVLMTIIDWHKAGTRYGIQMDARDGLLKSGVEGVQLTWMDVKVNDWVVTPRTGKAVEINALWYNALRIMADFTDLLLANGLVSEYLTMAQRVGASFQRFWNSERGYCYDVLDTPEGTADPQLRPNQIFAVSLTYSPLTSEQQQAVVNVCEQYLVTPHGLRSLAPFEANYSGHYGGDILARDSVYHQGTVWGWLIGAFAIAHWKVYQDAERAREFLAGFEAQLQEHGLGTLAEIFDGDAPHTPRGCIAQAWSVAEVLRAWQTIR